ncbi:drug resistance transporter, EmrB/QacA subfamily [Actinacidiphila rubida]|uniref:Drug resistance transporter, EmrB/QacA subfamily n=1 Tax=Actinacidiphila rubida TaxID=310780 RepID=A0A1H8KCU5_9ACTN|nr:MFS transporter [Actinacidiphila rubida]SEN90238.1 drug resistance transporter, EmrB/QacA subfamily [Actinacidiphila rubida]
MSTTVDQSQGPAQVADSPHRMTSRQRLVLILLLGSQFMLAADFSILNVALPDIGTGLHFSLGSLQWVTTAFSLAAAGFTLLFGRVADLFGRRRLFLTGIAMLTVASLVGGLAATPAMLVTGRVFQGLATAIVTPAALSLLTTTFPEGPLRAKALGLNGAMLSAGFITGAVLGGVLTDLLSWRWTFFINVPVGAAVFFIGLSVIKESRVRRSARLDLPGAVTVSVGLLALVYGISTAQQKGWTSARTLLPMLAGAILLVVFWLIELRADEPLVSVRVVQRRTVRWGNLGGIVTFTMASSLTFLMTLYLQRVLGYSPLVTGLTFGLLGAAAFAGGTFAPRLIGRVSGPGGLMTGLVIQASASFLLVFVGDGKSWITLVLVGTAISGYGHITAVVSFMVTATSGLPDEEQGLATGLATLTQLVGLTLGVPLLSTIATAKASRPHPGHSDAWAVLSGVRTATLVNGSVLIVGALVLALFHLLPRARRTAALEA